MGSAASDGACIFAVGLAWVGLSSLHAAQLSTACLIVNLAINEAKNTFMYGGVRIGLDVLLKAHQGIYKLHGKYCKSYPPVGQVFPFHVLMLRLSS